jgi:hypothetical protein
LNLTSSEDGLQFYAQGDEVIIDVGGDYSVLVMVDEQQPEYWTLERRVGGGIRIPLGDGEPHHVRLEVPVGSVTIDTITVIDYTQAHLMNLVIVALAGIAANGIVFWVRRGKQRRGNLATATD